MEGWVKVHRSLLNWEWWHDHNTFRLFLYLILKANIEDKMWKGVEVKRGQLITSRAKLATETSLSEKQIRTSLSKLQKGQQIMLKTGREMASNRASRFSTITVCNYDKYQGREVKEGPTDGQKKGQQRASNRATTKEERRKDTTSLRKNASEDARFAEFWTAYPRKKNKIDAQKAWKQIHQTRGESIFEEIMAGLQRAVTSPDWTKNGGQYIPHPASWLRAGGWMDETGTTSPKTCQTCRHHGDGCRGKGEVCSAYEVTA